MQRWPAAAALALTACGATGSSAGGPTPPPAVCGDGTRQAGEECDDGNTNDLDGCLRTCQGSASFVASDPHLHGHGCSGDAGPAELVELSSERGVAVTTPLVWGDGYAEDRPHFTGSDDPVSRPGALLHYELEISHFPAAQTGHLLFYGLRSIDFSTSPFRRPSGGMPVTDWARAQGPQVVVGMAHGQFWPTNGTFPDLPDSTCCMPFDFPTEAVRGRVTFLGSEHRGSTPALDPATAFLARRALNAGARVALLGASDYPCINRSTGPDVVRTDVLLEGELSYDRWLAALQRGRTSIAVGRDTRLDLRVNGVRLGDELRVRAGATLRVTVEARFPAPAEVQILGNGAAVASASFSAGGQAGAFELRAERSLWLQAASLWATTSPIYVVVDERPIRGAADDICYLVRYHDHLIRGVERGRLELLGETGLALAAYREVRDELARRFAEAGGAACP